MKKTILLLTGFLLFTAICVKAAPVNTKNTVDNTRIISTAKDTTITYNGVQVFIPAGHTLVLGQSNKGDIIVRGNNLKGVKIGDGTISSTGKVLLSIQPDTQTITVNRGTAVRVLYGENRVVLLSAGDSVSTADVQIAAVNVKPVVSQDQSNVQEDHDILDDIPAFVAETETSSAASEQAAQDVIETKEELSKSAP